MKEVKIVLNYDKIYSRKLDDIKPLAIGKFFAVGPDVVSLGIGEPDFVTPMSACQGGIDSLLAGHTAYAPTMGVTELRQEIAMYLKRRFALDYVLDDVLLTVGASEGLDSIIRAFIEKGDEVIIPSPSFSCYIPIVSLAGGVPVNIDTYAEDGFKLQAAALKAAITPKTKIVLLSYPNNPTGADMTADDYIEIAEVLRGTDILVLCDEIYAELCYTGKHSCLANIADMRERSIYLSGFSKAYAMTGWRLGYVAAPQPLLKQISKVHQFAVMSAPTVAQYAAIAALKQCDQDVKAMVSEYDKRRRFVYQQLNNMGLDCYEPEGAFYIFPSIKKTGLSSEEFADKLLEEAKVAVVPGTGFGPAGEGFVRISYAYSMETLAEAMQRLADFVAKVS